MRALCLFLVLFVIAVGVTTSLGQGAKDVVVTNAATAPVPVRTVDDPARRAFQLGFEVNGPNTVMTPAGKIFVVEHVSGSFRLGTTTGSSTNPCRFFQLGLPVSGVSGPPEVVELIPTLMGVASGGINNDVTLLSLNHSMKFYIRPNMEIGGVNSVIGGSCTPSPILTSRVLLSGYLVDSQ